MKTDTATITTQGQMTVPKRWRERAGLLHGGPVCLTWLEDEEGSLQISPMPHPPQSRLGLGCLLLRMSKGLPSVPKHTLP